MENRVIQHGLNIKTIILVTFFVVNVAYLLLFGYPEKYFYFLYPEHDRYADIVKAGIETYSIVGECLLNPYHTHYTTVYHALPLVYLLNYLFGYIACDISIKILPFLTPLLFLLATTVQYHIYRLSVYNIILCMLFTTFFYFAVDRGNVGSAIIFLALVSTGIISNERKSFVFKDYISWLFILSIRPTYFLLAIISCCTPNGFSIIRFVKILSVVFFINLALSAIIIWTLDPNYDYISGVVSFIETDIKTGAYFRFNNSIGGFFGIIDRLFRFDYYQLPFIFFSLLVTIFAVYVIKKSKHIDENCNNLLIVFGFFTLPIVSPFYNDYHMTIFALLYSFVAIKFNDRILSALVLFLLIPKFYFVHGEALQLAINPILIIAGTIYTASKILRHINMHRENFLING